MRLLPPHHPGPLLTQRPTDLSRGHPRCRFLVSTSTTSTRRTASRSHRGSARRWLMESFSPGTGPLCLGVRARRIRELHEAVPGPDEPAGPPGPDDAPPLPRRRLRRVPWTPRGASAFRRKLIEHAGLGEGPCVSWARTTGSRSGARALGRLREGDGRGGLRPSPRTSPRASQEAEMALTARQTSASANLMYVPQEHEPVLAAELIDVLDPQPGETFVDCTFGGGGHSRLIAERIGPEGELIAVDRDPTAEERWRELAADPPSKDPLPAWRLRRGPGGPARRGCPPGRDRLRPRNVLDAGRCVGARLLLLI